MSFDSMDALIRDMSQNKRVVAVFKTMNDAEDAFNTVCRRCLPKANGAVAKRANARMTIKQGDGSIRFTSERVQLRGCSCDVFYRDDDATIREWMVPLILQAQELYGVEP